MKKIVLLLVCILSLKAAFSQKGNTGFMFKATYAIPNRPGMDKYINVLSDSLKLPSRLQLKNGVGIGISYLKGSNKAEFEAGGDVTLGFDTKGNTGTNSATVKTTDIALHFGGNYLPAKFFLIGGHLVINSMSGKLKVNDAPQTLPAIEQEPDTDFNIFKGYSVGLRAQAGFVLPLSGKKQGEVPASIRILPFYQLGFTKYNYYNSFDNRLKNFTGDKKTTASFAGASIALVIGIK